MIRRPLSAESKISRLVDPFLPSAFSDHAIEVDGQYYHLKKLLSKELALDTTAFNPATITGRMKVGETTLSHPERLGLGEIISWSVLAFQYWYSPSKRFTYYLKCPSVSQDQREYPSIMMGSLWNCQRSTMSSPNIILWRYPLYFPSRGNTTWPETIACYLLRDLWFSHDFWTVMDRFVIFWSISSLLILIDRCQGIHQHKAPMCLFTYEMIHESRLYQCTHRSFSIELYWIQKSEDAMHYTWDFVMRFITYI